MSTTGPAEPRRRAPLDHHGYNLLSLAFTHVEQAGNEAYELEARNVGFLCAEAIAELEELARYFGVQLRPPLEPGPGTGSPGRPQ